MKEILTVTRDEYNHAIDIIEAYHEQLGLKKDKTPILEWKHYDKCSVRLRYALRNFIYIEDVSQYEMERLRNCGRKTWQDFLDLKNQD